MKKHLSKLSALLLAVFMVFGLAACSGDSPDETLPDENPIESVPDPDAPPELPTDPNELEVAETVFNSNTPRDTLVVGSGDMMGIFIDGFSNTAADVAIWDLTGGFHNMTYTNPNGQILLNDVIVKNVEYETDDSGNKTYTFTLHDDLKWNDSSAITAKDYIAALLLYTSPAFEAAGGYGYLGDGLVGYYEYNYGETDIFAGARVLGEFQFALTISADMLPYFWETSFVSLFPVPFHSWLPGNDIISDESGSRFANDTAADCERIAGVEAYAPTVSCGPYRFISFDGESVTLQRNPHFKGDPYGNKPTFEYVIQKNVPEEERVNMILAGDLDLVSTTLVSEIEKARADDFAVINSYLSTSYGFLSMPTDFGAFADINVRHAIARLIDRNAVVEVFGGYAGLIDAQYGMGQWTYQAQRGKLAEQLTSFTVDLEQANDYLDQSEWVYEADGKTAFDRDKADESGNYMRHNSAGEMLTIRHLSRVGGNGVGSAIETEMTKNAPLIGMKYEITYDDFDTLLDHWYYGYEMPESERYNCFDLSLTIYAMDDKYWQNHSNSAGTWANPESLNDPEIDRLVIEMRRLSPSQTEEHADLWVEFQVRWQEILPQLPLYSNEKIDVYNSVVMNVPTGSYTDYVNAICLIRKYA